MAKRNEAGATRDARRLGVWLCGFACACSPRASEPAQPEPIVSTADPLTTDPAISDPPVVATATVSAPANPAAPDPILESRFLPHERACNVDADCAASQLGLSETLFCCDACGAVAGTKAWVARANDLCTTYQRGKALHRCPPRDCGPPARVQCLAGQCAFASTSPTP